MKRTGLVVGVLSVVALSGVVFAFLTQSSPYVTVAQAKENRGNRLHLAGTIEPNTVMSGGTRAQFVLRDDEGATMPVLYEKPAPPNLATAERVVAIGGMKEGVFVADDLLLKCPTKYEGDAAPE